MSKKLFELIVNQAGREHRIRFDFDLSLYSHQVLHGFLERDIFPEPGTSAMLCRLLRPGDHFIDVGAHIGYFSMLAAAFVGATGCVYSLEPSRDNFSRLIRHLALNHFDNVIPVNCAAAIQTGPRELFLEAENDGGHAIWDINTLPAHQKAIPAATAKTRIFAVALDDLFPHPAPNTIRALKIDVEGAEMEVLRGAQRLLSIAQIPVVICECHRERLKYAGASEIVMRDFMHSLGYDTYGDGHLAQDLVHLDPGATLGTKAVFNLIFAKPAYRSIMMPLEVARPRADQHAHAAAMPASARV